MKTVVQILFSVVCLCGFVFGFFTAEHDAYDNLHAGYIHNPTGVLVYAISLFGWLGGMILIEKFTAK